MRSFSLELQSPALGTEHFDELVSFIGRDASGSFSIWPGAEKRITVLDFGLASFRTSKGITEYLALAEALLYFRENRLFLVTEHYVHDQDLEKITAVLRQKSAAAERSSNETRRSLRRLDEEIIKRLGRLGMRGSP